MQCQFERVPKRSSSWPCVIQAPRGMFASVCGMCVLEGCTCLMDWEQGGWRTGKRKHTQLTIKQKKDTRTHAIAGSLFGKAIARSSHEKCWRKKKNHINARSTLTYNDTLEVTSGPFPDGQSRWLRPCAGWGQALCNAQHLEICHVNLKWMKTLTGYFPHKLMRG